MIKYYKYIIRERKIRDQVLQRARIVRCIRISLPWKKGPEYDIDMDSMSPRTWANLDIRWEFPAYKCIRAWATITSIQVHMTRYDIEQISE